MENIINVSVSPELIYKVQNLPLITKEDESDLQEHDAEPIKDLETIQKIASYYLNRGELRNYALFVTGINVGLRISDLLSLRFKDIFNEDGSVKDHILIKEKKTRKTNKHRAIGLSKRAEEAIIAYRNSLSNYDPELYIFRNESRAFKYTGKNEPMTRQGLYTVLDRTWKDLGLTTRHGTHLLRKTFAYQVLTGTNDPFERSRRLEMLMRMFNHSSIRVTLAYAGISREEEMDLYHSLDFGLQAI